MGAALTLKPKQDDGTHSDRKVYKPSVPRVLEPQSAEIFLGKRPLQVVTSSIQNLKIKHVLKTKLAVTNLTSFFSLQSIHRSLNPLS